MSVSKYLRGVEWDPWAGMPGIYATPNSRRRGSWRYICTYRDGKRHKKAIMAKLRQYGQPERPGDWDLHHIVEGQHFADIDFAGVIASAYHGELPCVLIHKQEHVAYNRLLHIRETDELFRDSLPSDLRQRSDQAAERARDPANHGKLREQVMRLMVLYRNAYEGDAALQRIARNVFDDSLSVLRRIAPAR